MVPYQKIFYELQRRKIRYLVAGGFAVNFHQVQRSTVDLDLILHLEKENVLEFVAMTQELGLLPRIPVKAEELADDQTRKRWVSEKGLMVFSFYCKENPYEIVDVFIEEPMPFHNLYQRKLTVNAFGFSIDVLGKQDLIDLKKAAGRAKDIFDVRMLEGIDE